MQGGDTQVTQENTHTGDIGRRTGDAGRHTGDAERRHTDDTGRRHTCFYYNVIVLEICRLQ